MIPVNYPAPEFKLKEEGGKQFVFDTIRKTWLVLTPEEWVRQNFINYLVREMLYPAAFIALEKTLLLNDLKKRFDILVYSRQHQPWMMVECKSPDVPLTDAVLQQLLRYHISIPVPLLVISNGTQTMGWKKENNRLQLLQALPAWPATETTD
jgi:hypothetical protein